MDANGRAEARTAASDYVVTESPLGTARKLRVLMVGAGASGLNLARHMDLHMENFELRIYEKNSDVGGTWFENRYPGCACDIPSHNYQFTWEPNPDWTQYYSEWDEILEYFRGIAQKYELYKYIKLSHKLTSASWDEASGVWNVECLDFSTGSTVHDWGHVLINGTGVLNNWKWPDVPGLHSFKGDLFHSATWDPEYQVAEKTVAVLGTGSSGIQIVATLQPLVKSLVTFIRSPTWITAGFAQSHAGPGGANFSFTEEQKSNFKEKPDAYMRYRKEIEGELNSRFRFVIADSADQKEAREYSSNEMRVKLKNEDILNYLMPKNFAVGCRRPTPGNGYLEALTKDNVRVVTKDIEKIVSKGIQLTNGEIIPVDALICATGFDLSFCPRFKLIGRDGESIDEKWKDVPEAYLSVAVPGFPNYFVFLGPNAPVGHGSVLPIIEHATKYIINMMKKIQSQNIKAVSPSAKAVDDFNQHITEFMKRTAWATPCRSWFKRGTVDGRIVALHPGSRIHWFHMMSHVRYEDWEYTYHSENRFQYLGNGFSTKEGPGKDTTWYFEAPEEGYEDY
ncbi:putative sterigmatocystin biosynthesis monooxygenase stcW [Colletotrichum gloeosporioides]|uniref:Putative sterigmatocystin biosynthesis monooxygenase stcW n=1 Tax=Colletotrichum gloeosporioides TaxID=474922 RepID=A0A8H4CHN8_COLGL|nr:putative sterigmatocystin biosynthesis monooxygenase stcW [Colletotrichum gloeosporioides]KAF3804193.1 putative sterigmatocystin biosynthesis monooxygenase stcW [Colletotrichum gloeosporioides]